MANSTIPQYKLKINGDREKGVLKLAIEHRIDELKRTIKVGESVPIEKRDGLTSFGIHIAYDELAIQNRFLESLG